NEDSQIRSNAVGCLQSVASAAPKLLYPHWNHLLLDSHASMPSTPSLFTLIQYEAMPEVRAIVREFHVKLLQIFASFDSIIKGKSCVEEVENHIQAAVINQTERLQTLHRALK
ncbi:15403_t:CDS:2, partial [Gigaspora rosea]